MAKRKPSIEDRRRRRAERKTQDAEGILLERYAAHEFRRKLKARAQSQGLGAVICAPGTVAMRKILRKAVAELRKALAPMPTPMRRRALGKMAARIATEQDA